MGFTRFWTRPEELDAEKFREFSQECRGCCEKLENQLGIIVLIRSKLYTMERGESPMNATNINISQEQLRQFCERNHIRKLALFGSVLRDDFTPQSDIDALVEFTPGHRMGLIGFAGVADELGEIFKRRVDLNTPSTLSRYFREEVLAEAETLYVAP